MMSLAEEPVSPQTEKQPEKQLEKSLDAITALRKAMIERIAEAEARAAKENQEKDIQAAQEKADAEARAAREQEEAEAKAAQERVEAEAKAAQERAEVEAKAAQEQAEAETKAAQERAEAEAKAAQEQAEAEAKAAQERAEAEAKKQAQAAAEAQPDISFDPIEWSQIMMRVSGECQKLVRDYIIRTRDKPIDTVCLSPTTFVDSFSELSSRFLENPEAYTDAQLAAWQNSVDIARSTLLRMQGHAVKPVAEASASDKRFKAKDWQSNWVFDFLKQSYLSNVEETKRLVQNESADAKDRMAKKLEFYSRLALDASAPNNYLMTNPEVLRATFETKGENLIKGFENLLRDLESGNGLLRIRMSDYDAFELGKNIATTPGKVVYQNDLMQLIQYAPSTPSVRRVPFLIIPPWINKYYILDLRQKNSFINYLVSQGHTVFCISWINPSKEHACIGFEDYMDKGALTALREVKRLTGEDQANVLGYCIGGTLLACSQAHLARAPEKKAELPRIASATYLVTMTDFSQPGDLGVFIDEDQIRLLEDRMARQGFMDGNSLMLTFNVLRSNDLIWPFVINNYLLGREPFPFDILYWNTDSTNLPAAMQSYYLRNMYLGNKLIEPNGVSMLGTPLDLAEIETPSFLLSTREDHIAPWKSTYASTQLYKGPVTFCLSGSGHIAGVVNPPEAKKYGYWTNDNLPENPDEWLDGATEHKGSWWPEWIKWLDQYAGEQIAPRAVTDGIEDAPGSYVKVRVA